ncbi:hypothetical protein J2T17_005753 [Paenibacillus mucilaginosus]
MTHASKTAGCASRETVTSGLVSVMPYAWQSGTPIAADGGPQAREVRQHGRLCLQRRRRNAGRNRQALRLDEPPRYSTRQRERFH